MKLLIVCIVKGVSVVLCFVELGTGLRTVAGMPEVQNRKIVVTLDRCESL